jgi:hypothetical protein
MVFTKTRTDIFANFTNFIDRLRILSAGQIMDVNYTSQITPSIYPEYDAGLV